MKRVAIHDVIELTLQYTIRELAGDGAIPVEAAFGYYLHLFPQPRDGEAPTSSSPPRDVAPRSPSGRG